LIKTNDNGFAILSSNSLDLRKTDSQGNIQWSNDYTGTTNCEGKSVIQTNDGGYAILANKALYLSQFGNTYDIVLIKTDEDGNEIWRQTYKETDVNFYDVEFGFSIIQTNDEGFIIAGYKQEVRYNGYEYSVGDENFLLIETDANGNEIWNKTYDKFNSTDMATSIVSTVDGGYTIAGYTQDLNETHYVRLLKIDSVGNIDWERMFEIEEQVFPSVVTTSDGGYAFIDGSRLIKTDAIGNQKWGKQYNFSFSILTSTINNGFALANVDGRLLITDMDGNLLGSDTVVPYLRSIVQASDGGFVVLSTGHFYNDQPVLIKTNVETGLANVSLDENSITLYRGLNDIYWNYVRVRIWRTD